ncbi:MAG TPA: hypothetical protein EYN91_24595, partial [Candidatus Melainabacteria bacterium]|nr:hypothetical protein [Candidatus Melainabacteria bacterium]
MVSTITRSYSKENGLLNLFKRNSKAEGGLSKEAQSKLPALAVPRAHPSAAGLIPIWDLFHDDDSGLGVVVLKDGSYRCCFEVDGVHVSGFDEIRLVSLMNHF